MESFILNGKECHYDREKINYERVVKLAGLSPSDYYTCTYHKGDKSGTLRPSSGQIRFAPNMVIDIVDTGAA